MIIAAILGIAIALAEEFSAAALREMAAVGHGPGHRRSDSGASIDRPVPRPIAWVWMKVHRSSGERFIVSGSSGLIAGESLMGVTLKLWEGGPVILKGIWHSLFG